MRELVRAYGDVSSDGHKRDRSESGDQAPAGKRGARERSDEPTRSPSALNSKSTRSFRDERDAAVEDLELRVTTSLSRDLHDFRERMSAQIERLLNRVQDLDHHVEQRDSIIDRLSDDLLQSRQKISTLQSRIEDAKVNSRLPCLVLSGPAMAPHQAPRLQRAGGEDGTGQSAPGAGGEQSGARERSATRGGAWEEREGVNTAGVDLEPDNAWTQHEQRYRPSSSTYGSQQPRHRAFRAIGAGQRERPCDEQASGAARERLIHKLVINEAAKHQSLLAAKREKKIYTVFSRGGLVFFNEKQHETATRLNSLQQLRELGYTPLQR